MASRRFHAVQSGQLRRSFRNGKIADGGARMVMRRSTRGRRRRKNGKTRRKVTRSSRRERRDFTERAEIDCSDLGEESGACPERLRKLAVNLRLRSTDFPRD